LPSCSDETHSAVAEVINSAIRFSILPKNGRAAGAASRTFMASLPHSHTIATMGTPDAALARPTIQEAEYLRMVERFDRLWGSATSEQEQREMQKLIVLIEHYEAAQKSRMPLLIQSNM
jgi:hypothetical protein